MTADVISFLPLTVFSFLSFWKPNAVLFMITAGISLFVGFYWRVYNPTPLGLAISLCIIAYAFYCLGLAFRMIFWREPEEE